MRKTSGFGSGEGRRPRGLVSSLKEVGAGAGRESEHSTSSESERCDPHTTIGRLQRATCWDRTPRLRQTRPSWKPGVVNRYKRRPFYRKSSHVSWLTVDAEVTDSNAKTTSESVSQKCDSHLSGGDGQREKSTIKEQEDLDSSSLTSSNEIRERFESLKIGDLCPLVSPPMTETALASMVLGQMNLMDQEKTTTEAAFLFGNHTPHDLCESQLLENKDSNEEQDLKITSGQEPESPEGSENNKPQVRNQIHSIDGLVDLSSLNESTSECCESPYFDCENFMLLIEELGVDCKDPAKLWKIRDALHSWKRSIEFEKNRRELLTLQNKQTENEIHVLLKELNDIKKLKLQLEHQNNEQEQDIFILRSMLRQEVKKRKLADILYEKIRGHLRSIEEQFIKEIEVNNFDSENTRYGIEYSNK
ncbi:Ankyrin repeat domain-containing protein 26 [Plecturocebus cupreus]